MKVLSSTIVLILSLIGSSQLFVAAERDLRSQLMEFKTLIPQSKLRYIVNKHFTYDAKFRHVIEYMNTPEFDEVVQMVQDSFAYQQVIKFLRKSGVNTTSIENISDNINLLLSMLYGGTEADAKRDDVTTNNKNNINFPIAPLQGGTEADAKREVVATNNNYNNNFPISPLQGGTESDAKRDVVKINVADYDDDSSFYSDESSEEMSSYYNFPRRSARSLQTFTHEIAASIPRKGFRQMVEQKMQVSKEFEKFYTVVNCKEFRHIILSTLRSKELDEPMRILKRNGINVRSQSLTALKVLSWGPRIK